MVTSHRGEAKPRQSLKSDFRGLSARFGPVLLIAIGCLLLLFVDGPGPIALIAIGWLLELVVTLRARD